LGLVAAMKESVRPLTSADLDWVVDLAGRRAAEREPFAPRFWHRAPGARAIHATFLGGPIENPEISSLRTDNGFAFGMPRPGYVLIDDLAVDDEARWPMDGRQLIRGVAGPSRVRLVCPAPEKERTALAVALGLRIAEIWWHRDLEPAHDPAVDLDLSGGRLVVAPPVYDPGGPVLLATEVRDAEALRLLEEAAAASGARVSVVSQRPDDPELALLVTAAGYRRTCDFRVG
jgi:hypothetical protein